MAGSGEAGGGTQAGPGDDAPDADDEADSQGCRGAQQFRWDRGIEVI